MSGDAADADRRAAIARADAATVRADAADADRRAAEARAIASEGRADRAEQTIAAERSRIDTLQMQLVARQEVVDAAEAVRQADDARLALGRWARLRRAWRGR